MRRERERECDGRGIVYAPIYAEEAHRLRWNTHSEQDLRKRKLGIVVFWYGDHVYVLGGFVAVRSQYRIALYPGREIDDW